MKFRFRELLLCLVLVKPLESSLQFVITNPLLITRCNVFEEWIVFMPQQQSWTELVMSFFLDPVNPFRTQLSILFFFPISRKCVELVDLIFPTFCASLMTDVRGSASTTSLRVLSWRDHFILPVCRLTSSNLSSPCRNLWNHLCAVRTGTDPSPNVSLMFLAVSEAVFPSLHS